MDDIEAVVEAEAAETAASVAASVAEVVAEDAAVEAIAEVGDAIERHVEDTLEEIQNEVENQTEEARWDRLEMLMLEQENRLLSAIRSTQPLSSEPVTTETSILEVPPEATPGPPEASSETDALVFDPEQEGPGEAQAGPASRKRVRGLRRRA